MYTLENITTAVSYSALKRRGFTDAQMVEYYNFPNPIDRKRMFARLTQPQTAPKITVTPTRQILSNQMVGTHLCTAKSLMPMITENMTKDFIYRGRTFNMKAMGWEFEWSTKKNAFGTCARKRRRKFVNGAFVTEVHSKRIQLSKWLVDNSESTFEEWVDTMLHEIAHAIDVEIRGVSDHSYIWKSIASSVGARPERTTDVKINADSSKYTMTCISCGNKTASHKKKASHTTSACVPCCNTYNNGKFSRDYKLIQTQNY